MLLISEKPNDVGKVESKHMRKGDTLILIPNKAIVKVTATLKEMENGVGSALCSNNVCI